MNNFTLGIIFATASLSVNTTTAMAQVSAADSVMNHAKGNKLSVGGYWKSHTNLTHPGKYFRPSKVKIMRPTSPK